MILTVPTFDRYGRVLEKPESEHFSLKTTFSSWVNDSRRNTSYSDDVAISVETTPKAAVTILTTRKTTPTLTCDVRDRKYQVSSKYAPDQTDKWPYPMEIDGWVQAHNALRGEMTEIRQALEAIQSREGKNCGISKDDAWVIRHIDTAWSIHEGHVREHQANVKDILVPYLRTRFVWPKELEEDHIELEQTMDRIGRMICTLQWGDSINACSHQRIFYVQGDTEVHNRLLAVRPK